MTYFFSEETRTRLSGHVVAADSSDIGSILSAIKKNSSTSGAQKDEVIVGPDGIKVVPANSVDEEKVTKLSDHVVAADSSDIGSILSAISKNSSTSGAQKDEVIVGPDGIKVVPANSVDEEKVTKLSDHVVAGYWYNDYPQVYQFEKNSLAEHRKKMGAENFAYSEGKTSDGRLYFVISIRLKIDQILPYFKVHKFLMVYSHNFCNQTSGVFGGQSLRVYPADPDESYYYRNGEIFHHLLPRDEENRHYMCRAQSEASPQDVNAYNSIEEILRWLLVFYIWKASGTDIDK